MILFHHEKADKLIEQLTNYPDIDHDDEMDACIIGAKYATTEKESSEISILLF
jgi:phage terminase large subunit-like protein